MSNFRIELQSILCSLLLMATQAIAQPADKVLVRVIEVVNELGRGVEAEIRIVDSSDKDIHFAYTDGQGAARPNRDCNSDARFAARPKINIYRKLKRLPYCASEVKIVLQRSGVAEHLAQKGDAAATAKDYRLASMLYAESAFRIEDVNPELAGILRNKALTSLQREFPNVRLVKFDSLQDKKVLSTEGVKFVRSLQVQQQLPETGLLDLKTLQTISGQPIFPYIKDAYKSARVSSPQSPFRWENPNREEEAIGGPR